MKLYLSSYEFGTGKEKLVEMAGKNKKTAVITNALDFSADILRRNNGTNKEMSELRDMGFIPEELDLREFFGRPEELSRKIPEFGLIWG